MYAVLAEVVRNGFVESVHYGSVVGLAPDGTAALLAGRPGDTVLPRSTTKPFQATACLAAGAPLAGERLAIAAGSHTGEEEHVKAVTAILADAGLTEDALQCPPDWPEDEATREALIRAGSRRARIRMNCSGKHAAMLAAAVANGWSTADYLDPAHPLQRQVRATMADLAGEQPDPVAVDGCGAPLFGLTLIGLARTARALVVAEDGPVRAVADAMRTHPDYVGGHHGHVNTELMRALPGAVAKGGAEGVLIAATAQGHAVAVKVIDGSPRATTAIALRALAALGAELTPAAEALADVPVLGGGRRVGEIHVNDIR